MVKFCSVNYSNC